MSTRDNPFFGSGKFGSKAMQKLNQMARRVELFGVNATSPVMATAHGTVMLYRRRNYREDPFAVEGDEVLYAIIMLREYDENGDIVELGDETDPLAEGHTLKPTWQPLTEITVVTDVQYDASTHQLQKKTRTILVPLAEAESAWTMITGGQASTGCT